MEGPDITGIGPIEAPLQGELFPESKKGETMAEDEQRDRPEQPRPPQPSPALAVPAETLINELTALKSWKAQRDIEDAQRAEQARLKEHQQLAEKGQFEELVKRHTIEMEAERRKAADAISRHKRAELNRELAMALASQPLVKGAAQQLSRLWAEEFEVVEQGDTFQVRSRDLKTPADWVREKLASEEYAHFVKAESRGGGGSSGGATRQPTNVSQALQMIQGRPVLTPEGILKLQADREDRQNVYHNGMGLKPIRN